MIREVVVNKGGSATILDLKKDIFRWKVDGYPALIFAAYYGAGAQRTGWPVSDILFRQRDCLWFSNWEDVFVSGANCFQTAIKKDRSDFLPAYYTAYRESFIALEKELRKLRRTDLCQLNPAAFKKVWTDFFEVYSLKFWSVVIIPEVTAYTASHFLTEEIKRRNLPVKPEDISLLTAFFEKSFLMAEEYDLLKLAPLKSSAVLKIKLARHTRKWRWILNGYQGEEKLDEKFFARRLRALAAGGYQKKIADLHNYSRSARRSFRALVKKYHLPQEIINLARIAQRGSYLQDYRKKWQLIATEEIMRLYQELARRLKISLTQSLYIIWPELDWAFAHRQLSLELARRAKHSRLFTQQAKFYLQSGDNRAALASLEKKYSAGQGREIKGQVAYAGKVSGLVKIVKNSQEVGNFPRGRILVTQMTSPDYIMAIKKAKAIVTDDGGLTCHAAIVARELKKPCIVGTRNATRLLKDGDEVEVDAHQGIVKIIRRSYEKNKK